jgi:arylformamidase
LERGDVCNSSYFTACNHAGTHVDAPRHFNIRGRAIGEYSAQELDFHRPAILDVKLGEAHLMQPQDLPLAGVDRECDILLLRTGSAAIRRESPKQYVERGPGFSRSSAEHLLDSLPKLRALAVDFISVSSTAHEAEGAEAHRVFLGCEGYGDRGILLIEDVRLEPSLAVPSRVIVAPWMLEGLDSAPCSVLAEFP